jgi:hypothetical protein
MKTYLTLNQAPRNEDVWGNEGIAPAFLTLAVFYGEWSDPRPSRFNPEVIAPDTHSTGGRVGPRAGLDVVRKRKNPIIAPAGNPTPVAQPAAYSLYNEQKQACRKLTSNYVMIIKLFNENV